MDYTLAQLAPGLDGGVVTHWHAAAGDTLAADDDLLDVTTDKAVVTIPAPAPCTLAGRTAVIDQEVTPDTVVASLSPAAS